MRQHTFASNAMKAYAILAAGLAISVRASDVHWITANPGESQADSCLRNGLDPLYMGDYDLNWNVTVFQDVVINILNRTIDNSNNPYGLRGCCAPGLWCDNGVCFTQGFDSEFSNYGWLSGDTTSTPVYTCTTASTPAITLTAAIISEGTLTIAGTGFASSESTTSAYVYGERCDSLETCNCWTCNAANTACPPGHLCFQYNSDYQPYCFLLCSGPEDTSCPCGQTCMRAFGEGASTTSLCITNTNYAEHVSTCSHYPNKAQCSAARAYQTAHVTESLDDDSYAVSMTVGSEGAVLTQETSESNTLQDGFCKSDTDCFDSNLCTTDTCNTGTALCSYTTVDGCNSILPTITARQSPYMYYTYYSHSAAVATTQASSVATLLSDGTWSSVSGHDDYPLQEIALPFEVVFFGNLATTAYISANGQLALPPEPVCGSSQCHFLTTQYNAICPFTADWNPRLSPNGKVMHYLQNITDSTPVFGVTATALHVLYDKVVRYHNPEVLNPDLSENTFAASLYSDSSIRLSFITITTTFKVSDYIGLWGAFASGSEDPAGKYLRYHQETVANGDVVSGTEMLYCPLAALACPVESCVAPGQELEVRWNGTTTCAALGSEYVFKFTCAFAGGLALIPATLHASQGEDPAIVTCAIPELNLANDTVLSVDIIVTAVRVSGTADVVYQENAGNGLGSKTLFGAYVGENNELARSSLLVRYHSAPVGSCGCNGLPDFAGGACDVLSVCGGHNATADCAGVSFGSAVSTDCQACVGGLTNITPNYYCAEEDNSNSVADIISQAIILLMVICCLVFLTMSVTYSIRRMMAMRALTDDLNRFNEQLMMAENEVMRRQRAGIMSAVSRGLTEFECDALGQVSFTKEYYDKHKKEQHDLHHAADSASQKARDVESLSTVEEGTVSELGTNASSAAEICECTICLSEIEEGAQCRVLPAPCGHIFHVACIDQWFAQSFLCPLCKRSIRAILLGNDTELIVRGRGEQTVPDFLFNHNGFSFRLTSMRPASATSSAAASSSSRSTNLATNSALNSTRAAEPTRAAVDDDDGVELSAVPVRYARQSRRVSDSATHSRPFVYARDSATSSSAADEVRAPPPSPARPVTAAFLYQELETSRNSSDDMRNDSSENLNSAGSP